MGKGADLDKINENILGNLFHQVQAQAVQLPVSPYALPGGQWSIAQQLAAQLQLAFLSSFPQAAAWTQPVTALCQCKLRCVN